jgi:multidrug transporter EmrE-like cation transporter
MFRMIFRSHVRALSLRSAVAPAALVASNLVFNIVANASFKLSATSPSRREFLVWQLIGNLAGLITVLTLTGLLRFVPLHVAYPVTAGLAVIGVQVMAAGLFFHESISPAQWLGTLLVAVGIALISGR